MTGAYIAAPISKLRANAPSFVTVILLMQRVRYLWLEVHAVDLPTTVRSVYRIPSGSLLRTSCTRTSRQTNRPPNCAKYGQVKHTHRWRDKDARTDPVVPGRPCIHIHTNHRDRVVPLRRRTTKYYRGCKDFRLLATRDHLRAYGTRG